MALDFPNNPSDGDTYQNFTYDATYGVWNPAAAAAGGSGTTTYATIAELPLADNTTGDQAFVEENNRLYIWNGTGWFNIALINTNPSITSGADAAYELAIDGTPTVLTLVASDPEGLPITWSYTANGLASEATISQADNVFTVTPSTNEADAGTFSITFTASDGVNLDTAVSVFTLEFITFVENSKYTTALITSVGSNGGTNSTVTDSSTNNHTVTVSGNTSSQTFSPYRSGGYSYYFDGSGDTLTVDDPLSFGTSDFTVEFWYNPSVQYSTASTARLLGGEASGTGATWGVVFSTYAGANGMMFGVGTYGSNTGGRYVNGYWGTKGQWDHIVWQRNSGTIECYINGVSQTLSTMQQNFTWSDGINITGTKNLTIGSSGSAEYFTGYMKELKITNGSALYTSGVAVPTEAISVGSADFLGLHLPYLKDSSSNNHTITITGDVSAKPFGPYDYDEYDAATHGGSIVFDGNGDYLLVPTSNDLQPLSGDFTAECWVKCTTNTGSYQGVMAMNHISSGRSWRIWYNGNSDIRVDLNGQNGTMVASGNFIGKWIHIAYVKSGSNHTFYVNGTSRATYTTATVTTTTDPLIIGAEQDAAAPRLFLNGYISDLRITKAAVYTADFTPPTEPLTAIANTSLLISSTDASIVDKSQSTDLTLYGNTQSSTTVTKYGSSSMYFDGSGDYIRADDAVKGISAGVPFTIEAWVYPVTIGGTGTGTTDFLGLNAHSDGANILTISPTQFRWNGNDDTALPDLSANQWQHVAFVYDGSTAKYYVDGTLTYTLSGSMSVAAEDCSVAIGCELDGSYTPGNYFNGYLEDVRFTKGLARYTANFTPPTASLEG